MKVHMTEDKDLARAIKRGLLENEGYCPCIANSRGQEKYKCICQEMREQIPVGESCHCGLFIKDEQ